MQPAHVKGCSRMPVAAITAVAGSIATPLKKAKQSKPIAGTSQNLTRARLFRTVVQLMNLTSRDDCSFCQGSGPGLIS